MPFNQPLAKSLLNPWKLRFWMLKRLPMGLASGMTIVELNEEGCKVQLRNQWWIRNPFGSVFWAVMSMSAELSTGALVYAYASGNNMQFILVEMRAKFYKKVKPKVSIFAGAGRQIEQLVNSMQNTSDARIILLPSIAQNESGETVAEFEFYWQLRNQLA